MADITYANKNTGDQFTAADANEIKTAVNSKVDKVSGKQLSDENYTSAEKSKLAGLANYYKGTYPNLAALETAHPTGQPGWEAIVDESGTEAVKYIWDDTDNTWVLSSGSSSATFAELGGSPTDNAALASALNAKVDKVTGKGLSTNDFDATAKAKVDNLPSDTNAALTAKADDSEVVKLTGAQSIAGVKEFASGIIAFRPISTAITGTSYTLALTDANRFLEASNAAAQTITIPTNASVAFAIGAELEICRAGAGEITISPAGGVTLKSAGNRFRIAEIEGAITLKKIDTNTWRMIGGIKV